MTKLEYFTHLCTSLLIGQISEEEFDEFKNYFPDSEFDE